MNRGKGGAVMRADGQPLRVVSYGGGVQSTALLVLAAEGRIDYLLFLYADVGERAETATVRYLHEYALPYATAHGVELATVVRRKRDGTTESLWQRIMRPDSRSIDIPVRMANGAPGNRRCTEDFKIRPIAKELKRRGATADNPATLAIGISVDELHRSRTDSGFVYIRRSEPLIDLRLGRADCGSVITRAGLPLPPKSACVWCPYQSKAGWARRAKDDPEGFADAVTVERVLQERRAMLGKDAVYLHPALIPLDQVIVDVGQQEFDFAGLDVCESGYCEVL